MQISIIVPVYNTKAYLRECVDSILSQTMPDFEVLLVDDGSTDGSDVICDEYERQDARVKAIHKPNGGATSARKVGISAAAGDYIASVDSDDYIAPDLLMTLCNVLKEQPTDVVCFGCTLFSDAHGQLGILRNETPVGRYEGATLERLKAGFVYDKNQPGCNKGTLLYNLCCKLIRRELLTPHQMRVSEQIHLGSDFAVVAPMIGDCQSICVVDEIGYYYRQNAGSITHVFRPQEVQDTSVLLAHVRENAGWIEDNSLCAYAQFLAYLYATRALQGLSTYADFQRTMQEASATLVFENARRAIIAQPRFSDRMKSWIIRKNKWHFLWMLKKRRIS